MSCEKENCQASYYIREREIETSFCREQQMVVCGMTISRRSLLLKVNSWLSADLNGNNVFAKSSDDKDEPFASICIGFS